MPEAFLGDEDLISGCLEGKKRSWDVFVQRFSKLVYWSIQRTLEGTAYKGRRDLYEEVFQELFTRLIEKQELQRLREIKSVRKFLSVMACHMTWDRVRHLSRLEKKRVSIHEDFSDLDGDFPMTAPADLADSREKQHLISEALGQLSLKERSCVELHYVDGKTHHEISLILGFSQDTVSTIIRRTKEKLKSGLEEHEG